MANLKPPRKLQFEQLLVERRSWRITVLACLAILGLYNLIAQITVFSTPLVYMKDFKQEYMLARAVLEGTNPYLDEAVLAERYLPDMDAVPLHPGPVPHPPFAAVIAIPFGLVSYEVASAGWFVFELILLVVIVYLIAGSPRSNSRLFYVLAAAAFLLSWRPVMVELYFGNLSMLLTALIYGSWFAFKRSRYQWAGILLGLAVAVKIVPIIIVAYFVVKRRWTVVIWAAASLAVSSLIAILVVGWTGVVSYITRSLPLSNYWQNGILNYSLPGIVARAFKGSVSVLAGGVSDLVLLPPVLNLPSFVTPVSVLVMLCVLLITGWAAAHAKDPDAEFALALCAMLLVNPVTWQHYLILLAWPIYLLAFRLREKGWTSRSTWLLLTAVVLLSLPVTYFTWMALILGPWSILAAQLILMLMPAGIALLYWMLLRECRTQGIE